MALNAEVLTSYKKIDEAYIDELLKKEIEKNNKKISLCALVVCSAVNPLELVRT